MSYRHFVMTWADQILDPASIEGARFKKNQNKKQSLDLEEPGENHVMNAKGIMSFSEQ